MNPNICLLTFDLEEFVMPKEMGIHFDENKLVSISVEGLKKVQMLLKQKNVKATFFTTKTFAEHKEVQTIIKELLQEGHELACHGYDHMDVYTELSEEKLASRLKEAKKYLEKTFHCTVYGFRAPRLQNVSIALLKNLQFSYDASLHPTCVPYHYNNFFAPRKIFIQSGITIIPISVTPLLRLPYSWIWFRTLGLWYAKACTALTLLDSKYIHLYFHSWDFYSFELSAVSFQPYKKYLWNTDTSLPLLQAYMSWLKKKNIQFQTLHQYLTTANFIIEEKISVHELT